MVIDTTMYAVELGMGTFDPSSSHKTVYLGFDTGSDLIWTQCEGCENCFLQKDPFYPFSKSYTYRQLPCHNCPPGATCVDNTCRVTVEYGDGAVVEAVLSYESFTFQTPTTPLVLDDVLFGCGINMLHFDAEDKDENNRISGLFGMNYGELSFQEQQRQELVHGKFQYCLQKKEADQALPPMFLRFGDNCIQPTGTPRSIPMFRFQNRPIYYIDLRGIRVGQKVLAIPPNVFQISPDGNGGTVIDSGAEASYITTEAYKILEAEVAAYIESRNSDVKRDYASAKEKGYELCYKRESASTTFDLPWVTLLFPNDVNFQINPNLVFDVFYTENGQVLICLYIFESEKNIGGVNLLGSLHQVGHRITYDLPNGQLLVADEDCNLGR
ncbi:aspartic proteinase nepenthesin-2-like [Chenopodium quinoa]|uniref:aspartic proteinase nepenthesin-2-like n=1 Tax=Chenopodium quinoa TaxID=63459 RepID=UPI000B772D33|nr:aspartic proteinase nepenthesin-2-like [Chenopodium quinoa]